MKSHEIPPCKTKVPDPYKFYSILYELWLQEHGVFDAEVVLKKTDGEGGDT